MANVEVVVQGLSTPVDTKVSKLQVLHYLTSLSTHPVPLDILDVVQRNNTHIFFNSLSDTVRVSTIVGEVEEAAIVESRVPRLNYTIAVGHKLMHAKLCERCGRSFHYINTGDCQGDSRPGAGPKTVWLLVIDGWATLVDSYHNVLTLPLNVLLPKRIVKVVGGQSGWNRFNAIFLAATAGVDLPVTIESIPLNNWLPDVVTIN